MRPLIKDKTNERNQVPNQKEIGSGHFRSVINKMAKVKSND